MSVSYTIKRNEEIYIQGQSHTTLCCLLLHGERPRHKIPNPGFQTAVFYGWNHWKVMRTKGTSCFFTLHRKRILPHLNSIDFLCFSLLMILIMSRWTNTAQMGKYSWQTALLKSSVSRNDHLIQWEFSHYSSFKKIFLGCELWWPKRGVQSP